jgi:hypothetical protein
MHCKCYRYHLFIAWGDKFRPSRVCSSFRADAYFLNVFRQHRDRYRISCVSDVNGEIRFQYFC